MAALGPAADRLLPEHSTRKRTFGQSAPGRVGPKLKSVFGEDYDRDRIMDFEDGTDRLYLLGVTDQQEFDALNIRQSGDDLIINYGRGDQLVIEDLRKQDLTIDDLVIV